MERNQEKELSEILKKLSQVSGKKSFEDFDTGLLDILFEPTMGTSEEKYNKTCDKLVLVLARLKKIYMDNKMKEPQIISDIESFFDESRLPFVSPTIEDYTQREGRIITINREDQNYKISCTMENFNKIVDRITEEQYGVLTNKAKKLLGKAVPYLADEIFKWHRDDLIVEVEPWKKTET